MVVRIHCANTRHFANNSVPASDDTTIWLILAAEALCPAAINNILPLSQRNPSLVVRSLTAFRAKGVYARCSRCFDR